MNPFKQTGALSVLSSLSSSSLRPSLLPFRVSIPSPTCFLFCDSCSSLSGLNGPPGAHQTEQALPPVPSIVPSLVPAAQHSPTALHPAWRILSRDSRAVSERDSATPSPRPPSGCCTSGSAPCAPSVFGGREMVGRHRQESPWILKCGRKGVQE